MVDRPTDYVYTDLAPALNAYLGQLDTCYDLFLELAAQAKKDGKYGAASQALNAAAGTASITFQTLHQAYEFFSEGETSSKHAERMSGLEEASDDADLDDLLNELDSDHE